MSQTGEEKNRVAAELRGTYQRVFGGRQSETDPLGQNILTAALKAACELEISLRDHELTDPTIELGRKLLASLIEAHQNLCNYLQRTGRRHLFMRPS